MAFSGDVLLSASDDEKVVLTDTKTGTRIGVLSEHIGRCLSVAVPVRTTDGAGGAIFATGGNPYGYSHTQGAAFDDKAKASIGHQAKRTVEIAAKLKA